MKPAELGEPCITGSTWVDTCAVGAVCDGTGTQRCVAPKPVGTECEAPEECEALACVDGRCREPLFVIPLCERKGA